MNPKSIFPVHIVGRLGLKEQDAPNLNINHTFDSKNATLHYSDFCICSVCKIIVFSAC